MYEIASSHFKEHYTRTTNTHAYNVGGGGGRGGGGTAANIHARRWKKCVKYVLLIALYSVRHKHELGVNMVEFLLRKIFKKYNSKHVKCIFFCHSISSSARYGSALSMLCNRTVAWCVCAVSSRI